MKRTRTAAPQLALIDDGHAAKLDRDREHEVDRTPCAVCRQGLEFAIERAGIPSGSPLIDIGAGGGVFGQQYNAIVAADASSPYRNAGDLARPSNIAIEPREEEAPNLRRHYSTTIVATFATFAAETLPTMRRGTLDTAWVACNPAFSIFQDIVRTMVPQVCAVLLYGSIAWGCSEEGAELFEQFRPTACGRVRGRVHHRGPGRNPKTGEPWGADQRDVCWWLWQRGKNPTTWATRNLPLLASVDRQWKIPPGTEP